MGGWVSGWVGGGKEEGLGLNELLGIMGGHVDRGREGGSNELLYCMPGVGGWVGGWSR